MNSVKFFIILILISFTQASPTLKESSLSWNDGNIELQPRIVNGTDATIEEFPFILSIHNLRVNETTNETYFAYTCGGSILNSRWFLTAAHCVTGANPARHLIKYATTDITNVESRIAYMEQLFMHEDYNATIVSNDIAVGKVKDPFEINILGWQQKLPLRYQYFPTGTPAILAGWGRIGTELPISNVLQKVDYYIYSQRDCSALHGEDDEILRILPENICGGYPGGWKGQCSGDSGGPLMAGGVQVGIVSWSIKPCTVPPYPGVFTNVAFFIDWIEAKMNQTLSKVSFLQANE